MSGRGPSAACGGWDARIRGRLEQIRAANRWRAPRTFDAAGPTGDLEGAEGATTSFASNDYLGLTTHPEVRAAAVDAIGRWGTGAGAARLVVGSRPVHARLEEDLADWRGTAAAAVFPTGYAANTGVLATLATPGTRICSDALNHASIIDGCRMARAGGAEVRVYAHGDLDELAALLDGAPEGQALVVTDSVFSMDGDVAPLEGLAALCTRHGALLVVDEAHSVLGPEPPPGIPAELLVRVGTLSKALASQGGFVAASRAVVDLVVNAARPYIFTTALSPADAAAARAALSVLRSDEGRRLRTVLRDHVDRLRPGHPSPIIPVILGDEERAVRAAAALAGRGLLVPAIRPPTVPAGTSRLRVALSAAHRREDVDHLADELARLQLDPTGQPR